MSSSLIASSEKFTSVAFVGASGTLGSALTNAFLTDPVFKFADARLIVRPGQDQAKRQGVDKFVALGAKVVEANLSDESALAEALKGIDLVVSAYGGEALLSGLEGTLIRASKKAGVKRFLASAFGVSGSFDFPLSKAKNDSITLAQSLGLNWTAVHTAVWSDFLLYPAFFGVDVAGGKVSLLSDGKFSFSTISLNDATRFAVRVAFHPETRNKEVGIATQHWASWNDFLAHLEQVAGKPLTRVPKSLEDVNAQYKTTEGLAKLAAAIQSIYITSKKDVDFYNDAFNRKHPEWVQDLQQPTTVQALLTKAQ